MSASAEAAAEATGQRMDRMYRHQRHIYDLSRKFYLLGRDRLIAELALPAGAAVCEVGCGTGRNLIALARRFPAARLYGIDASEEMLKSASAKIARRRLGAREEPPPAPRIGRRARLVEETARARTESGT